MAARNRWPGDDYATRKYWNHLDAAILVPHRTLGIGIWFSGPLAAVPLLLAGRSGAATARLRRSIRRRGGSTPGRQWRQRCVLVAGAPPGGEPRLLAVFSGAPPTAAATDHKWRFLTGAEVHPAYGPREMEEYLLPN
jgi:hypothetical protein